MWAKPMIYPKRLSPTPQGRLWWKALLLSLIAGFISVPAFCEDEIQFLVISGDLTERQRQEVKGLLARVGDSLTDITAVKRGLEISDWIATTDVTYRWPDELLLTVTPEKPIAYWNDQAFINDHGKIFSSDYIQGGNLPQLYGQDESVGAVMRYYHEVSRALFSSGQRVKTLQVNERGSVEFELSGGWRVLLGNVEIGQRLQRAFTVMSRLEDMSEKQSMIRLDARYSDGVAINGPILTRDVLFSENQNTNASN